MIETSLSKVKINEIIQSQIPEYIDVENPYFGEFLKQYYYSQEFQGGSVDIADNLVEYKGLDYLNTRNLIGFTSLTSYISGVDDTLYVKSTDGWPKQWGLLKIDDEIITYTGIGSTSFIGCVRGFSGIEKNTKTNQPEHLTFSTTGIATHASGARVQNLSNVFLNEFLKKLKTQVLPGFEERELYGDLNESNFIRQAKDFYKSKGTEEAFNILFKALYNEEVEMVQPQKYLIRPSDAEYIRNDVLVCELISGDPRNIQGQTLFQDTTPLQTSGSVYNVESVILDGRQYYKVAISKGTTIGKFVQVGKTYVTKTASVGSTILNVDSTVGFGTTGNLDFEEYTLTYTDKNYTQFLGVSGISTTVSLGSTLTSGYPAYSYENGDLDNQVTLNVVGLINEFSGSGLNQEVGSVISVKSLGIEQEDARFSSWIYNTPTKYQIDTITSLGSNVYQFKFFSTHVLYLGDVVDVVDGDGNITTGTIVQIISDTKVNINCAALDLSKKFFVRRQLKVTRDFTADVQNTYSSGNDVYVASNSFPHWQIDPQRRVREFTNSGITTDTQEVAITDHNYNSGDLVIYNPASTNNAVAGLNTNQPYYVKKIDANRLYLAYSPENARRGQYITVYGGSDLSGITTHFLTPYNVGFSTLGGQKLLKKFPVPEFGDTKVETKQGGVGLFANGVEIYSYKSTDKVFYGSVETVDVLNSGSDFDVINPPRLSVYQSGHAGVGASVVAHMSGQIREILVDDPGLDYVETPTVSITGGNGRILAEAKMKKVAHEVTFDSTSTGGVVNTSTDKFTLATAHGFKHGEEIIYNTDGTTAIGIGTTPGTLISGASYYVIKNDDYNFSLAQTRTDALVGIATINIITNGQGYHSFTTKERRLKVDKVLVTEASTVYNRQNTITFENINLSTDVITLPNHGFRSGEKIKYSHHGGTITGGLTTTTDYYAIVLDNDNVRLSISTDLSSYVNLTSHGSGYHVFGDHPIILSISGRQGISTSNATATPIIRGGIYGVSIKEKGDDFGSTIINDNYKPEIRVIEGSKASLKPLIVNGRLNSVIIKNGGENYFSVPDVIIAGDGVGAKVKAVVANGQIIRVDVIDPGAGYTQNGTTLTADTPGSGAIFSANLKEWTVNQVERYAKFGDVKSDDGFYETVRSSKLGNPYVNYYVPRNLRTFLGDDGTSHSPILGYAYDGNPIYGPYAFTGNNGTGPLKYLQTSYANLSGSRVNGPDITDYPAGFFVEDYTYVKGSGDLDEHNGRFCVTPEYPNGVYAYFTTVSSSIVSNNGSPFNGSRQPLFPYVIGDTYHSVPDEFNFEFGKNQNLDPIELGLVRNTAAYKIDNGYEFISNAYRRTDRQSRIQSVKSGSIDKIEIIESGIDYNVNDRLVFDNTGTSGFAAVAKVSEVTGVAATNITSSSTVLSNVVLKIANSTAVGILTVPHNLNDGFFVNIVGVSSGLYSDAEGIHRINVETTRSGLATSLLASGITTSVPITDIVTKFKVNDILQIDSEKFLVTGLDIENNKLNLLRKYDGTVGAAHTNRAEIVRLEREFSFDLNKVVSLSSPVDEVEYFDASSSVGVGLSFGVGIGTTISYVGSGNTTKSIFIPTKSIFLPNHKFNHGEKVTYRTGGGTALPYSTDGVNTSPLPSEVYIQKLSKDLVGVVTTAVGINSDLSRVYFNGNIGIGNTHSFTSLRNVVTCSVRSIDVVVSTASSHNLRPNDIIDLSVVSAATSSVVATYSPSTKFVSIGSSVNPPINVVKGDYLEFDTSDSNLSDTKLEFFLDQTFVKKFVGSGVSTIEISEQYAPGITSAKTTVHFTENVPEVLYYKFTSLLSSKEVSIKESVKDYGKIVVDNSAFTGKHTITTSTNQTFTVNLRDFPERVGYTSATAYINYTTNSTNAIGPISKVKLLSGGKNYKKLPSISVASSTGSGSALRAYGSNIGAIDKVEINEFGYDYPSDKTLQPQAHVPQIIFLKDNYSVDTVAITSTGSNYLSAPDLIVYNEKLETINTEVDLLANLNGSSVGSVDIVSAGGNLKSTDNKVIAINNTNGVGIISATYSAPNVTLRLETPPAGFSTDNPLPFQIGEQVFVENVGVSTGSGYNSADHGYRYWTITGVNTAFGLVNNATISYAVDENPGVHDGLLFGSVSNTKDLATFEVTLKEGEFYAGEEINSASASTKIVLGDKTSTSVLSVESLVGFNTGDFIKGRTSGSSGIIEGMQSYSGTFNIDTSIEKSFGWEKDTGKLNEFYQRIQDSDYYQQFAYSLKSKVGISSWSEPVDSLAHISGFKKHSDLLVPSDSLAGIGSTLGSVGIGSQVSTVLINSDPVQVWCKHDWDLAYEIPNSDNTISDKVVFQGNRFGDALICKSNRVLEIDDISPQFYSDPDINRSIELDSFDIRDTSAIKYYAQVVLDTALGITFNETQYTEFIVSHNGTITFNNQYSDLSDAFDLGDFSTTLSGTTLSVLFSPYNTTYVYDITFYKEKIENGVGVGTTSFGHIVKSGIASYVAASGSPTEQIIQSIDANAFKSGTVVVSVASTSHKNIVEASFLGIGSTAQYIEFGKMDSGVGLGTFSIDMTGTNDLHLKWLPAAGIGVTVAMLSTLVGVATTVSTGIPGTSYEIGDTSLNCTRAQIASSPSASQTTIATVSYDNYTSIKYLIEIHNTTDNEYTMFHLALNAYGGEVNYVKYMNLTTSVDTRRDIQNTEVTVSGSNALIRFLPRNNKAYIVRTSEIRIDKPDDVADDTVVTLP
jgi:hypothetical protein